MNYYRILREVNSFTVENSTYADAHGHMTYTYNHF